MAKALRGQVSAAGHRQPADAQQGRRARFDPPAFLPDFTEEQRVAWDRLVRSFFSGAFERLKRDVKMAKGDPDKLIFQFFDPTTSDDALIVQPITWNAFPKELLVRFGRKRALQEADRLWPLNASGPQFFNNYYDSEMPDGFSSPTTFASSTFYRPHVEYCEWHATRDEKTGRLIRVTFTSEPPEYWIAMFGGPSPYIESAIFPNGRRHVLKLYQELVSPDVRLEDLIASHDDPSIPMIKGGYNIYNKWNTTHGIAHLCAPPNSLGAEVTLGAEATLRRVDGRGSPVSTPDALICCADFGGVNRNSDPTIGASVNALARLGAMVTLPNPVGLYMDHIDLSGWETPDGSPAENCVKIVRGSPGMIERLVVEAPPGAGFTLGDVRIGAEAILYGGQIAECITVKLNGGAKDIGKVPSNEMLACVSRCCVDNQKGGELGIVGVDDPLPSGTAAAWSVPAAVSPVPAKARAKTSAKAPEKTAPMAQVASQAALEPTPGHLLGGIALRRRPSTRERSE